ncbi:MAG TPA: AbiV family abortive infection protein [Candidatus Saccharimonadales bacterium]|nr:AbiV family abortive infection protein [Candidatus Saccharimonadales bacterium]
MSKEELQLTPFEIMLHATIYNIIEKTTASIALYKTKYSYPSSYYLAIIAQEEVAKLFMLPLINEFGGLDEVVRNKRSPFYNHKIKQKIFSSFVYFQRNWESLEEKKQATLYVGFKSNNDFGRLTISPEENYNEIKNLVWVYFFQTKHMVKEPYSKYFLKVFNFSNNILIGCLKDQMPELLEDMKKEMDKAVKRISKSKESIISTYYEDTFKNPYELIRIYKKLYKGDDYKNFIKRTYKLSFQELVKEIGKDLEEGKI